MLAHLSEDNNTEELAYETLVSRLKKENIEVNKIIIAKQNKETDLIKIREKLCVLGRVRKSI